MKTADLIKRIDELIAQADKALEGKFDRGYRNYVDNGLMLGFKAASLSFLGNLFKAEHPYYVGFSNAISNAEDRSIEAGKVILQNVRHEIANGWLFSMQSLVSAEIFSDFLEMSNHLLEQNYKDPAAVLIGSVLEGHLKRLCNENGIDIFLMKGDDMIPKKADLINAELKKAEIYNTLDQKAVTGWLELRNKAAHGLYDEYNIDQVKLMLSGVSEFMARTV